MPRHLAPLLIVMLTGALLLSLAFAASLNGDPWLACIFMLVLPLASALTTFRCSVSPLATALALSSPVALAAVLLSAGAPDSGAAAAWFASVLGGFLLLLLSGKFGRYRRRRSTPR